MLGLFNVLAFLIERINFYEYKKYQKRSNRFHTSQCKLREPDLLLIITAGAMSYEREDGVKVIPISCLKD